RARRARRPRRRPRSRSLSRPTSRRRPPRADRSRKYAELVQRAAQLLRVAVDAVRARARQLVLAVAAAQQADAEHSRAAGREQVPDGVADDVAARRLDAEPLRAREEEIGFRLRACDVAALDDD